ncbi:Protein HAPLESS 2 [Capsicum baccatum]|uniref:Protein HAPLESS 2 n=1 Tax=Capsicum baccatum TaxID=33114 RepID=A0A2G2XKE5_CAPBA|nr:Protein HAPLESS 2 [Capsicum baccatum]
MKPPILLLFFLLCFLLQYASAIQILSKSKLQKCEKVSDSNSLNCTNKVIIDLAVPSESSGNEASLVAEIVEVEENSSSNMRTLRVPPVVTINKSAAYALYELTYIRDVAYKPQEFHVNTRKCEPDAGADVVQICERLRDENGHIIENTQPTCCPCGGDQRRVPSSCGNFFDKMTKGKRNTAHCLRFPDDWFHVFGIGQRSVGFSIRIDVKKQSQNSEVIVGPDNRTATSSDNFLRVNLVGDYVGYTDLPSLEDLYLVIPRQGGPGQPQNLGSNFSMWMLLERVWFTLDGVECNKIGVGYDAFNAQPDFCSAPFWSCLHNQLWNFWDADQNRISRNQVPLYCVQGRFERINQHPVTLQNAGSHAFSIGITEVLNTNLLIELNADDIEYVYQRSPGKILGITIPTFEALTQYGTATITTKNIGEVEASYSLTEDNLSYSHSSIKPPKAQNELAQFDCSAGVSQMEEQFYIMKPNEVITRAFKLYPSSDQAAKYVCSAILKDSDFNEVDRAECQFTTKATVLDNGSQIPFQPPKANINGFFGSIEDLWKKMWENLTDFLTGKSCRIKCYGFFDFSCHIKYICITWVVMFGLLLAILPTVIVLLWLLHQKGLFDSLYDWWEDHFSITEDRHMSRWKHSYDADPLGSHHKRSHKNEPRHHKHRAHRRHTRSHNDPRRENLLGETDYHYYLHHVHKDKHKHGKTKSSGITKPLRSRKGEDDHMRHHRRINKRETSGGPIITEKRGDVNQEEHLRHKHPILNDTHHKRQSKLKE